MAANSSASLKYQNPSNSQEAFYIEARAKSGWNYYYPDAGVVIWHVDGNGHDATHWRNNLWLFAQRLIK